MANKPKTLSSFLTMKLRSSLSHSCLRNNKVLIFSSVENIAGEKTHFKNVDELSLGENFKIHTRP